MTTLYEYKDYREYLKSILEERKKSNHHFSLRACASSLEISPTHLVQILNKKRHLSFEKAIKIGLQLKLKEEEIKYFIGLVASESLKTPLAKAFINKAIEKIKTSSDIEPVKSNTLKTVSKWYHFAILEMTEMVQFKSDPLWIAKQLGLSRARTKKALQELKKLGFLTHQDGQWKKAEDNFFAVSPMPNVVFQKFHKETLRKAAQSLKLQDLQKRYFSSTTFAIDIEKLPEAHKRIRKFRLDMQKLLNVGHKTRVYQLAVQLFDLTKGAAVLLLLGAHLCFAGGSHVEGGGDYLRIKIKEAKFLAAQALKETPEIFFEIAVKDEKLVSLFKSYQLRLSEDLGNSPLLFYDVDPSSADFLINDSGDQMPLSDFIKDGEEKTAITASYAFAPIRMNLKRCKELNISKTGAAILLIRESARHLDISDDDTLDEIENIGVVVIELYLKSLGTKNEHEQEVLCYEALILTNIRLSQEISETAKSALNGQVLLKNYLDSLEQQAMRLPTYGNMPFICWDLTEDGFTYINKIYPILKENSGKKRKMVLFAMKLEKEKKNLVRVVEPEMVQFILSLFP